MEPILGMDYLSLPLNTGMPQPRFTSRAVCVLDRPVAVEIAFAKKSLRQLCESERRARRSLGLRVAEKLKRRIANLMVKMTPYITTELDYVRRHLQNLATKR